MKNPAAAGFVLNRMRVSAQRRDRLTHALIKDGVEIARHLRREPRYRCQILLPVLAVRQYRVHQLAKRNGVIAALRPELLIAREPVGVILKRITFSVSLAAIKRNECRQRKGQARRQRARLRLTRCGRIRVRNLVMPLRAMESS